MEDALPSAGDPWCEVGRPPTAAYKETKAQQRATGVGGVVLTLYNQTLEDFFEVGKEIEVFKTKEEALVKTKYYLQNDSIREKIARSGWKRTSINHTYQIRLRQMFSFIS